MCTVVIRIWQVNWYTIWIENEVSRFLSINHQKSICSWLRRLDTLSYLLYKLQRCCVAFARVYIFSLLRVRGRKTFPKANKYQAKTIEWLKFHRTDGFYALTFDRDNNRTDNVVQCATLHPRAPISHRTSNTLKISSEHWTMGKLNKSVSCDAIVSLTIEFLLDSW